MTKLFLAIKKCLNYFMCMGVLSRCMSMNHVFTDMCSHRGWNRALDPLQLQLQMVVKHYVDAGNQTPGPLNRLAISLALLHS